MCAVPPTFSALAADLLQLLFEALKDCCNCACKFSLCLYISFGEESNLNGEIVSPWGDSQLPELPLSLGDLLELGSSFTGPKGLRIAFSLLTYSGAKDEA
jgi:hypothetical protein